jgi:hypothetical protein
VRKGRDDPRALNSWNPKSYIRLVEENLYLYDPVYLHFMDMFKKADDCTATNGSRLTADTYLHTTHLMIKQLWD